MSEPAILQQPRGRGRPTFASVGRVALSKSERNRRYLARRGLAKLHVEVTRNLLERLLRLMELRSVGLPAILEAGLSVLGGRNITRDAHHPAGQPEAAKSPLARVRTPSTQGGRPLSQVERNRAWRKRHGVSALHVEVPVALAAKIKAVRTARGVPLAAFLEAGLAALGRYYTPQEDALLLGLGPEAERHRTTGVGASWEDAVGVMGRSTAAALRARFLKIEPVADREKRTGISAGRSARAKRRPCMVCGRAFESVGFHNRLCDPCRSDAW